MVTEDSSSEDISVSRTFLGVLPLGVFGFGVLALAGVLAFGVLDLEGVLVFLGVLTSGTSGSSIS
jgi:hypothetical protein